MTKKATRNDVAKLAGVSTAVVSYVVNGSNHVSEEKRQRVLDAIEQLHYKPNAHAQSLRSGKSRQIALIGDSLEDDLFHRISDKLERMEYYPVLFYSIMKDSFIDQIISMQFDAVFLTSNRFTTSQLNRIAESGTPIVLYRSREYGALSDRISVVVPDFFDSIRKCVDYLVLRGHRKFGYIPPLKYRTSGMEDNDYRTRAFREALQAHDIAPDSACYSVHTASIEDILGDVFSMVTSHGTEGKPDALIVSEDQTAALIIRYLEKLGLSIPEDIAVVGWGNTPISELIRPRLTTVSYDVNAYCESVVNELLALIEGATSSEKLMPVRLQIREST